MGVKLKPLNLITPDTLTPFVLPATMESWQDAIYQAIKSTDKSFVIAVRCINNATHLALPSGHTVPISIDQSKLGKPLCMESEEHANQTPVWLLASSSEANPLPGLQSEPKEGHIYAQEYVEMHDASSLPNLYWVQE